MDSVKDTEPQDSSGVDESFDTIFDTMNILKKNITSIQCQIKKLEKQVKRKNKQMNKQLEKCKERKGKKPSGFAQPSKISKELCYFMNVPEETEIARTEVTKFIIQYIKENNLQSESEKKIIVPDDKLHNLLNPSENDVVTFFNIQKFMNPHFIKSTNS